MLGCVYGGLGIVQAVQNTLNKVWGVPRDSRPNPVRARLRSLLLLAFGGASVIVTTVLSALGAAADAYGASLGGSVRALATAAAVALNVALFIVAFRVLTARPVTIRQIRAGAVAAAVTWQALQWAGTLLLGHELKGATATYGLFALVLGLLAWIYLGAVTIVICAEFNAVRAGQLWPRSLLAPFTDNADLTPADRRAYTSYAKTERHKSFENIDVSFGEPPHSDPGPDPGNHDPACSSRSSRRVRRCPSARARSRETCIWEMPSRWPISRLRHVAVEAHEQDLLLTRGQLAPVRGDGVHAEHVLQPRVLPAEQVSQGAHAGLAGQRGVQRGRLEGQLRPPGLAQLVGADPQVPGQVGFGRGPAQVLGQLPGRLADLEHQLLHGARDVDLPPLVAEVPLDLAADARPRVGGQAAADGRVEVADRLQQADIPHLHQVLRRLRAVQVPPHAGPDQPAVAGHEQLARRRPPLAGRRQRPDDAQQRPVIQPGQVPGQHPAWRGGKPGSDPRPVLFGKKSLMPASARRTPDKIRRVRSRRCVTVRLRAR